MGSIRIARVEMWPACPTRMATVTRRSATAATTATTSTRQRIRARATCAVTGETRIATVRTRRVLPRIATRMATDSRRSRREGTTATTATRTYTRVRPSSAKTDARGLRRTRSVVHGPRRGQRRRRRSRHRGWRTRLHDADGAIHPGAIEICGDGRDEDCDSNDARVGTDAT